MKNLTKSNIIQAIKLINENPKILKGRQSSTYDLIYEDKTYPPILVLSEANKLAGGDELNLWSFGNNTEKAFKILRDFGFEIISKSNNMKFKYIDWAKINLSIQDGTKKQYVAAISKLSKIVGYDIFQNSSIEEMNILYEDLIKEQRNKSSKYYNPQTPSLSDKGWYSASVKTYIDFLKSTTNVTINKSEMTKFSLKEFEDSTYASGLIFSKGLVKRFCASLISKPFVILTGLSGSGKTKLAQAFVQWICEDESQYIIVPVGADWTNREPLVGYPNGLEAKEYITPDSGVIHLLIEAVKKENEKKPFFLILDEMNLSHVERYFADFLSIMESNDSIKLYTGNKRKSIDGLEIELEMSWPKNLFIIGTVNIDETTYMFSPKVLDRANVIEFRITNDEIKFFLGNPGVPDLTKLKKHGVAMSKSFLSIASDKKIEENKDLSKELVSFFNQLQKVGAEFGYRSATEIMLLTTKLKILEPAITDDECLDIAIMQKLLPKLHGSRSKLVRILIALSGLCVKGLEKEEFEKKFDDYYKSEFAGLSKKYPISFDKLIRMYKNVIANGFTSYAEA
jgi:5-methylcytosine-specific restriction protein B